MPEAKAACAAVVLYRPEPAILARLAAGLAGVRLIAFANGPLAEEARAALAGAGRPGPDLRMIESPANIGLGAALNAVVEAARAEGFGHVFLLDQDSEPAPGLIEALAARAAQAGPRIAIVAPLLVPPAGEAYRPIRYAWRQAPAPPGLRAADFIPTSGSLLDLDAFAAIGPFREDFFIAGLDVEWGFRAWSRGFASYVAPDLAMPHRWGVPAAAGDPPQILRNAPLRTYYYARNVIATARLPHVPWAWRLKSCAVLAAQAGLLLVKGAPGAFAPLRAGISDALAGRMGPAPDALSQRRFP